MSKSKQIKILFFGDMVGKLARKFVVEFLQEYKEKQSLSVFAIANVENASHGFGLTEKNYNELSNAGFNCFTSGNHIWDKKDIFQYIEKADKLVRPINYPPKTKGKGVRIFDFEGEKIAVINVLGQTFMQPIESYWTSIKKEIKKLKKETPNIIVDFHAEATAEKLCLGRFCSELGVSAFFGTHTHVQTADEKIINDEAYITDVGFCGVVDSIIGMEYETSLKRLSTGLPERYEIPDGKLIQINAVEVTLDLLSGKSLDIKRIMLERNYQEGKK
ncbi:MAG: YmdB family metallophosphoesterase [bacterium]|nr:YmdB family metallophosphoesterase [bacterium]